MIATTNKGIANQKLMVELFIGPIGSLSEVEKKAWCIDRLDVLRERRAFDPLSDSRKMDLIKLAVRHNDVSIMGHQLLIGMEFHRNYTPVEYYSVLKSLVECCDKYDASDEMIRALIGVLRLGYATDTLFMIKSPRFHKVVLSDDFKRNTHKNQSLDIVFESGNVALISRLVSEEIPNDPSGGRIRYKLTTCLQRSLTAFNPVFDVVWGCFLSAWNPRGEHKCSIVADNTSNPRAVATIVDHPICLDALEFDLSGLFISFSEEQELANRWMLIQLSMLGKLSKLKQLLAHDTSPNASADVPDAFGYIVQVIDEAETSHRRIVKLLTDIIGKDLANMVIGYLV